MELKKSYSPEDIEDKWYEYWERNGYFKPDDNAEGAPFSIVIPPPNVTGSLHMGHALNATLQDVLARWNRLRGRKVLWLPGTDHAGIATQNVVERELSKDGLDRHRIGRDAFIERVWKWKAEYGGRIIHQLKKIGASCDWSRERFTLDDGLSRAVREVFVRLFEEGLIYRDSRLINWCPRCHTALSDLEVEYEELDGKLYYIKYPLGDGAHFLTVATTRPETMLGDTAVAVHPEDERYRRFVGKDVSLPLTGRSIPVIADVMVDPTFGTGAVKVTPAHDFNDEATGKRHNLQSISVIAEDGRMGLDAGERYAGLDRYACRKQVLEDLKALDLLEGEKKHRHAVGHCYRCKTIIEPLLTIQWYVRTETLAAEAVDAVREKRISLVPDSWENNYFAWMREIRDWCISRQIWWGHRIPVWYCTDCKTADGTPNGSLIEHIFFEPVKLSGGNTVHSGTYAELRTLGLSRKDIIDNSKIVHIHRSVSPVCSRADLESCPHCGGDVIRDPDVLDTWFSSALWPFSTLGWPEKTADLKIFYPTSVLVTGFDILFFWVARMIMMGLKFMDDVPFRDVYIHALVRDAKGQKMSKSKGNVIDPLVMTGKYGADAFRFSLAAFAAQGRDVRFSEERVEGYRHFINKLWNASKFILTYKKSWTGRSAAVGDPVLDLGSRWILSRLAQATDEMHRNIENFRFNDAANSVYQFLWHEFCDWYIEMSKPILYGEETAEREAVINCLYFVFEKVLQLLHPFMPFVTEELWHSMLDKDKSIMLSHYDAGLVRDFDAEQKMGHLIDAVTGIRSIRGELNISPSVELHADIKTMQVDVESILKDNGETFRKMARCKDFNVGPAIKKPKGSAVSVRNGMEIYIPMEGLLDVVSEIARLEKEVAKLESSMAFINKKLQNDDFINNAPRDVVDKERAKFDDLVQREQKMAENLTLLRSIDR
ncbi:MAG TPA: valine--tRNA ligase [Dissulfurispiraceae bacterium]|nr:valine--tRNA ligase [Dissulfurispiraceae bacterium]